MEKKYIKVDHVLNFHVLMEAFSYKFARFGFWEDMFLPFFKEVLVLAQYDMCIYIIQC